MKRQALLEESTRAETRWRKETSRMAEREHSQRLSASAGEGSRGIPGHEFRWVHVRLAYGVPDFSPRRLPRGAGVPRSVHVDRELKEPQRLHRLPRTLIREAERLWTDSNRFVAEEEQTSCTDEV